MMKRKIVKGGPNGEWGMRNAEVGRNHSCPPLVWRESSLIFLSIRIQKTEYNKQNTEYKRLKETLLII